MESPQQVLADALGGVILGENTISVGGVIVAASPLGKVRVNGVVIGSWRDDTEQLVAGFRRVVGRAA